VALERTRVERFEELETAKQFARDRHNGTPIVEFAAVLGSVSSTLTFDIRHVLTFGAENTVTNTLSVKNSYPSSTTM
jgi:hypothetical protein